MKKILLILTLFTLTGCYVNLPKLTNDEIIIEKDKCLKADMEYKVIANSDYVIRRVVCVNPKDK